MIRDGSRNLASPDSSVQRAVRPKEFQLNYQLKSDLFDRTNKNGFLDIRSFEVQQQEESSVHHKKSFSSTTSIREGNLRKAAISSSAAASEAASMSRRSQNGAISSDSSATSSRHFKTSASLVMSDNTASSTIHPDHSKFQNSSPLLSSPDVRSLVKEIGTDFAELENALISTDQSEARGSISLSSRLFGRRLLSPIGSGPQNSTLGGHSMESQLKRSDSASGSKNYECATYTNSIIREPQATIQFSRKYLGQNRAERYERSSGERIKDLLDKAKTQAEKYKHLEQTTTTTTTTTDVGKKGLDENINELKNSKIERRAEPKSDGANLVRQDHRRAAMIERIDQRMSDLCKKLNGCLDTKEAIDLLEIMIQMIEKAWSVPVCGDDLGFRLCNSLREAGGLDIILGFMNEVEDTAAQFVLEESDVSATPELESRGLIAGLGNESQMQQSKVAEEKAPSLKLNLSKVVRSVDAVTSNVSKATSGTVKQQTSAPAHGQTKDSDSEILTSDLGLDSTSVESLSYMSATQTQTQTAPASQDNTNDKDEPEAKHEHGHEEAKESSIDKDKTEIEDDSDLENELDIVDPSGAGGLDEEEACLRKEELVFLSARLLSQCLTSDNRNYIVENGLHPVIKLACNFTTMKSVQSHRLLARSLLIRQSSTVTEKRLCSGEQDKFQIDQQNTTNDQRTSPDCQPNQSKHKKSLVPKLDDVQQHSDHSDMHAIIGTEILQHLFKHSEDTCSRIISWGGLQAILYGCRSSNIETLRHCASALANLALYGGPDSQQMMIEQKAHVWLFPLAFNEDDNIQYYACLAIVVLVANQEIEADVLKSSTLNLVEPFVTNHEPQKFAESTTSHIHGQSASWLRKLIPLLESKREEARNLACFHFAMEAYIKREQAQTQVFKEIGAVEPLKKVGSSPIAIASKFACQALRLIGEKEPHKLSQQVPLWTSEDVLEWVCQIGFEKFKQAFCESRVDGDLLLQLDEEALRNDIGISNGIIRRRFLRELLNLKRIADYSSVDKSGLHSLFSSSGHDFVQYIYPMIQLGVTKENIHLLDTDQLLKECKCSNTVHQANLARSIKDLQERLAVAAASSELNSTNGEGAKTLDVFVSYRRATGSQLASLLKVHLQLRGFSVFIDVERLEAGKFDNNLLDSIKAARNFILVLSPNALDRCIGDLECKDWVHKEIVAALASNCNIIPIMDNFHWPDADQLPEDMRSICYFNGVRWIHDYQDACVDKVERFIRGEINNGCSLFGAQSSQSAQSSLQRLQGQGTYSSTPSIAATPSLLAFPSGSAGAHSSRSPFDQDHHPLSFASPYLQHSQNTPPIRR